MRKRAFLLLTACMMAVGILTGCSATSGQADSTKPNSETEATPESSNATAEETTSANSAGKTLVVYYSATGNTEQVAKVIAETTGGNLFELEPVEPYTDEDLDWTNDNSRVTVEHDNPVERDVELVANTVADWQDISVVYIGYPIWWGEAAWPVDSFIKANDFTGKTVIPFCTSSSSDLGESGALLAEMAGTGQWLEGRRFRSSASAEDVKAWVMSLRQE